jgi:hypothetical protein
MYCQIFSINEARHLLTFTINMLKLKKTTFNNFDYETETTGSAAVMPLAGPPPPLDFTYSRKRHHLPPSQHQL